MDHEPFQRVAMFFFTSDLCGSIPGPILTSTPGGPSHFRSDPNAGERGERKPGAHPIGYCRLSHSILDLPVLK